MQLEGKVAAITGAASGIGKATALGMAEEGASVVVNDIVAKEAEEVVQEIKSKGGGAVSCVADIGTMDGGEKVVQCAVDNFGRIDILVNNAGISRRHPLLEMPEEDWDEVIRVHLKGCFACTKAAARYMVQQRSGRIINISSNAGRAGNPGSSNYSAAKAGIIAFTKSIARELGPYNILANAVTPIADTPMMRGTVEDHLKWIEAQIALGRVGKPEEVAAMIIFLASDKASYSTGQIFDVAGGRYM